MVTANPTVVPPKRTIVFFDGQNLYHGAKDAWRAADPRVSSPYSWPSYDVEKIAALLVAKDANRTLSEIRFYTGVPSANSNRLWNGFWNNKLRGLMAKRIHVYRGRINPGGQEKGVDVSLAIDLIKLTYEKAYDLGIIVSQDWDFGPAVKLAYEIAQSQGRRVHFESAFANNPRNDRGVPGTTWVKIEKAEYDSCYDTTEYRSTI